MPRTADLQIRSVLVVYIILVVLRGGARRRGDTGQWGGAIMSIGGMHFAAPRTTEMILQRNSTKTTRIS